RGFSAALAAALLSSRALLRASNRNLISLIPTCLEIAVNRDSCRIRRGIFEASRRWTAQNRDRPGKFQGCGNRLCAAFLDIHGLDGIRAGPVALAGHKQL